MNSCLAVEDRQKLSHVRLMRVHNEKGSARKDELPLVCSGGYRTARVFDGLRGPGVEVTQHYIPPTGLPTESFDSRETERLLGTQTLTHPSGTFPSFTGGRQ